MQFAGGRRCGPTPAATTTMHHHPNWDIGRYPARYAVYFLPAGHLLGGVSLHLSFLQRTHDWVRWTSTLHALPVLRGATHRFTGRSVWTGLTARISGSRTATTTCHLRHTPASAHTFACDGGAISGFWTDMVPLVLSATAHHVPAIPDQTNPDWTTLDLPASAFPGAGRSATPYNGALR